MKTLSPLQEQALAFLAVFEERRAVFAKANKAIEKIVQEDVKCDFSGLYLRDIDGWVQEALCKFLDVVWGMPESGLAAHYFYEATGPLGDGRGPICCGKEWELRNPKDLRAYLIHANHQCKQLEAAE